MKYTLGFSPCPNDTFIFDALVNGKIDMQGLDFEVVLEDVQTLNNWALQGRLDFSKISYGVLPLVVQQYVLLNSGGALGQGVGPLLITNDNTLTEATIQDAVVAIPGKNTTAHLLFSLAFPEMHNKQFKVFHEIEDWLLQTPANEKRAGVIIHENRFTYAARGLHKIIDLGEYWQQQTGSPIPLGGIVAKRNIDSATVAKVDGLIKKSLQHAYEHHYQQLADYVKLHAQEMSPGVMRQHINLYVNDYSAGLGNDGKKAVLTLMDVYARQHPGYQFTPQHIFLSAEG
ncbi:1,4-dihydroxy-6-naphthoate synthase [Foetidibacter luteolus]|uniref:1,4-dihydroxy-6-naphthoate synthase n=1 Tax=Foetidibacter luteolus TaxID=2608880 RepID=UPI00129A4411|nr:1,4-dihydroxy-6-naphthoate synthase [Foetidibacter luteolus]